ncbi:MAG TPA: oligopeptide/dipeptide ABC transporter ATP-binding protein [Nevskiales bacterium]|nr:oligopeptide/dipeptide ABC transporter ATP-binding protein [Nevskiales bacterium]
MSARPHPLLLVRQLAVHYPLPARRPWQAPLWLKAVEGVNFDLEPGETLGIVGESGCGKSTLARALVGLQPAAAGAVILDGTDVTRLGEEARRAIRRHIQLVFQDPLASLDPRMTVGEILSEPLENLCPELDAAAREARVREMLERVGLLPEHLQRYPHEFSGGQCQRIGIARALVVRPRVLVCDEAVSALDVSIRAQIVALLQDLQQAMGLGLVFIAHDLAVVRQISHKVMVMYLGRVMEQAPVEDLFAYPRHPYTKALLSAVPVPDPQIERSRQRIILHGELPSPAEPPSGCLFRTRCHFAHDRCAREIPNLRLLRPTRTGVACHYAEEIERAGGAPR